MGGCGGASGASNRKIDVLSYVESEGSFNAALLAITNVDYTGTGPYTLYFRATNYSLTTPCRLDKKYSLEFEAGAMIDCPVLSGNHLWIDGTIDNTGPHQIFSTNLFPVLLPQSIAEAYFEWWGATRLEDVTNDTDDSYFSIQKALKSWRSGGVEGDPYGQGAGIPAMLGGVKWNVLGVYGISDMVDIPMLGATFEGKSKNFGGSGFKWVGLTTTNHMLSRKGMIRNAGYEGVLGNTFRNLLFLPGPAAGDDRLLTIIYLTYDANCGNQMKPDLVAEVADGSVTAVNIGYWKGRANSRSLALVFEDAGDTNAAGTCYFDPVTGYATNCVITNPGTGYVASPSVSVADGYQSGLGQQQTLFDQCWIGSDVYTDVTRWAQHGIYVYPGDLDIDFHTIRDTRINRVGTAYYGGGSMQVYNRFENVLIGYCTNGFVLPGGYVTGDRVYFGHCGFDAGTAFDVQGGGIKMSNVGGELNSFVTQLYMAGNLNQAEFDGYYISNSDRPASELVRLNNCSGVAQIMYRNALFGGLTGAESLMVNCTNQSTWGAPSIVFDSCRAMTNLLAGFTGTTGAEMRLNVKMKHCIMEYNGNYYTASSQAIPMDWQGEFKAADGASFSLAQYAHRDSGLGGVTPVNSYSQGNEPDIPNNTQAVWKDTDDSKYYLVIDIGGTQKKVELTP